MACTLLYNGDVLKRDVNIALDKLIFKNQFEFVDWVPTGFKIGINHHQPIVYQGKESFKTNRIACLISNSYAVNLSFNKLA
jgi:tubulin alpha